MEPLFDLETTRARTLFDRVTRPWQVLLLLEAFIRDLGPRLGGDFDQVVEGVWVGRGTAIDPLAALRGPAIIGRDCELRPGAFIRGAVLTGDRCVIGNSTELKQCLVFDGCSLPHFNYVGDSILGTGVHFGAGVIASNFKAGGTEVLVEWDGRREATGLTKLGVLAGDGADIGSQAVLNPGTVLGRNAVVYPLVAVRGSVPASTIVKTADPASWVKKRNSP